MGLLFLSSDHQVGPLQPDPRDIPLRSALASDPLQQLPAWVFLADGAARSGTSPVALSATALARRASWNIPVFHNDRALSDAPLRNIEASGARIRYASRWLGAVSVDLDSVAAARLATLPEVSRITRVGQLSGIRSAMPSATARSIALNSPARVPPERFGQLDCRASAGDPERRYGASAPAITALAFDLAHDLGFSGEGIRIALLDTGFRMTHESLAPVADRVVAVRDFIHRDTMVSNHPDDLPAQEVHGTAVWSLLAGCAPGDFVGAAYGAQYILAKVDDLATETRADEDRWIAALEWADSLGAHVVNSSLGYRVFDDGFAYSVADLDGATTPTSIAAAEAARRLVLVVAMGNDGPVASSLLAPADADGIVAVGAVDTLGTVAAFSSRGPTADGRLKPDLAAPGIGLITALATDVVAYAPMSGTSVATPLVAGAAAVFLEAWPHLAPAAARAALQLSASNTHQPDNAVGYGVPNVATAILFPAGISPFSVTGSRSDGTFTTLAPRFSWSAAFVHDLARPVTYRLEIATDSLFNVRVYVDTVSDAFAMTLRSPLRPAPRLWWRVVAETAPGLFLTGPAAGPHAMPSWVRLRTLDAPGGAFVSTPTPRLTWSALPAPLPIGPLVFDVEVFSAQTGEPFVTLTGVNDTTLVLPAPLPFNVPFRWRVVALSPAGVRDTVESAAPFVVTSSERPPATILYQNFPNPFPDVARGQTLTRIWFDLREFYHVQLTVHDQRGRLVRRLVPTPGCDRVQLAPGLYGRGESEDDPCIQLTWDGRDDQGRFLPRGVYLLRLQAGDSIQTRRMLFWPD